MQHVDEHTLELLALKDPLILPRENEIRAHLAVCEGCRTVFAEMQKYYEDVKREFANLEQSHASNSESVTLRSRQLRSRLETVPPEFRGITREIFPTALTRMRIFARRHPVFSSSFSAVLVVAAFILVKSFVKPTEDPSYYFYNEKTNAMEIYGKDDSLLWKSLIYDAKENKHTEWTDNIHLTLIFDPKGDGHNEVVTTVAPRKVEYPNTLRIYDASGNLKKSLVFAVRGINYSGQSYDAPFEPSNLSAVTMPDGRSDFFVSASNGRSPSFLARFNGNDSIVAKYWHYGNFLQYVVNVSRREISDIAITGLDDTHDISGGKFNFFAILDPTKIVGEKESPETPGFGLAPSNAELCYLKFPRSDIEIAEGVGADASILRQTGDSTIHVRISSAPRQALSGSWEFEYIFSASDLSVRDVKFSSPTPGTFEALKREGKVRGVFDAKYLKALKEGVEYWTGDSWVKTPTMIIHRKASQTR